MGTLNRREEKRHKKFLKVKASQPQYEGTCKICGAPKVIVKGKAICQDSYLHDPRRYE